MTDPVNAILALDRADLLIRWETAFGRPPPPHAHARFMQLALAWQLQAGGRGRRNRSILGSAASVTGKARRSAPRTATLRPGTRLVREWQGTTHHVQILESGFEYAGKTWRSLSAIARTITGSAWSGPAFFGIGQ